MADTSTWLRANRGWLLAGAAAAAVAGAFAISTKATAASGGKKPTPGPSPLPKKPGFILCPSEVNIVAPSTATLRKGDFVVVYLTSGDGKFSEPTWARVRSFTPNRERMNVEIVGEFTNSGRRPLTTDKHGFRFGDRQVIERTCVFEILHHIPAFDTTKAQVLCGPDLARVGKEPLKKGKALSNASTVKVVVASQEAHGTAWHETLTLHVMDANPTHSVVTAMVAEDPDLTTKHGLRRFSKIEFAHDCIIEIS